ncbi:hypothetical protein NC653_024072 [Populus alba x Populus x berolinensis]|uniref:Uncharacterized protein n=1 Tax=Populus alba x Populus x berolinensis TaxID=444605 RepID=A0AAD6MIU4_9ROSI|nr:hypothetical protein NC653_024072 [Populus alba x Populus x berolinensis]
MFTRSNSDQEGQMCVLDRNCNSGLHCETCVANGNLRPRCTGVQPIIPTSKYAWLTTHNSSAMGDLSATWSIILAHTNQQDTVTSQLNDGIRGLTLDMYAFQNDIWLCHSFGGNCYNIAAFQPAINVLKEINSSISRSQPIRNHHHFHRGLCYITSPRGLTKVFDASGLMKYWFPVSRMPKNGGKWPIS